MSEECGAEHAARLFNCKLPDREEKRLPLDWKISLLGKNAGTVGEVLMLQMGDGTLFAVIVKCIS